MKIVNPSHQELNFSFIALKMIRRNSVINTSFTGPPQAAKITVKPMPQTVLVGTNDVTFMCKASGVPTPSISWTKDDVEIVPNQDG